MTLDPALLVLIEGERDALRLVATWPAAGRGLAAEGLLREIEGIQRARLAGATVEYSAEAPLGRWARISGVDPLAIEHWAPILFGNDLIAGEGVVDEDVRTLVRAAGVRAMKGGRT